MEKNQLHVGKDTIKLFYRLWEKHPGPGGMDADSKPAAALLLNVVELDGQPLFQNPNLAGGGEKRLAGGGQLKPGASDKQFGAIDLLQTLHLFAHRLLGDKKTLGGPTDALLLCQY